MKEYSFEDQMALNIDKKRVDKKVKQCEETVREARRFLEKKNAKVRRFIKEMKERIAKRTEQLLKMHKA